MNKTKLLLTSLLGTAMTVSMTGCGTSASEAPPTGAGCTDWELEDGEWVCDDEDSEHYGYFYRSGGFYPYSTHGYSTGKIGAGKYKPTSGIKSGKSGASTGSVKSGTGSTSKPSSGISSGSKSGGLGSGTKGGSVTGG